jgi:hypothetical protein
MSNGCFAPFHPQGQEGRRTPACSVGAVNAQLLFPKEQAPSPPRDKGCLSTGSQDLGTSDGLEPAPACRMMTHLRPSLAAKLEASLAPTLAELEASVVKIEASLAEMQATISAKLAATKAPLARSGIATSIQISSSTTTTMSSPTAAGLANNVATAKLWIKEVCARQDAHLKTSMADFWLFADNLDHRQPSTPMSFEPIDDDDNNNKDEAIHIILSIDNADDKITDIAVVLAPPLPLPCAGAVVPLLGGNVCCQCPSCCRLLSQLPSCNNRQHANLNGLAAALVVVTNLGCPITRTRPFPPTLNQQWGGVPSHDNLSSNVGTSNDPSLNKVIADVLCNDFVFISLPPTLYNQ